MKPLDIVKTPAGGMGVVIKIGPNGDASIRFFEGCDTGREKVAWWNKDDGLIVVDSLPRFLTMVMCDPFREGRQEAEKFFPLHGYSEGMDKD